MTALQIFCAHEWVGDCDADLQAARAAGERLAAEGEALPIDFEQDGRLIASYDGDLFRVHQGMSDA